MERGQCLDDREWRGQRLAVDVGFPTRVGEFTELSITQTCQTSALPLVPHF